MKQCERCGEPVTERADREVRFCSIRCANQSRIKRKEKPCSECGKTFLPPSNHPRQKYCCLTCRDEARTTRVEIPCSNCGESVVRKINRVKRFETHFCSISCIKEYRSKHAPSGADHPQYMERTEYVCGYCGSPVMRLPSRIRKHIFCDADCRLNWQRESGYMDRENSPTWLGGHEDGRGPGWSQARRSARKRDGFACQRCGKTTEDEGRALDVHHIKPFRCFNGDYKAAHHLDNLITLCNSCHQTVEWESGARVSLRAID